MRATNLQWDGTPRGLTPLEGLRAFGMSVRVNGRPPGAWDVQPISEPSVELRVVEPEEVTECWSGEGRLGWKAFIDGAPFLAELGSQGDYRFIHGETSTHHLSADASVLRCAPKSAESSLWWRIVLDSVLFSVALIKGHEALHAAAVATPVGAIGITAATGGGKSTLLSELVRRQLPLIADDVIALEPQRDGPPMAHPAPPLMTVPTSRADGLGDLIASIEDESWLAVPAHGEAVPLTSLVVLDRRRGLIDGLHPVDAPMLTLMNALMHFPRIPERERTRFELASALASRTAVWRLAADDRTEPRALADLVIASLHLITQVPSLA